MHVLFGAAHTTSTMLTSVVVRLLERRQRWEALQDDSAAAEAAVEESVRFGPPVPGWGTGRTSRYAS
jgi:cytochrome P450